MIKAPSDTRCRSMPSHSMAGSTMASVSGMAKATTVPARRPRAEEANHQDDGHRFPERAQELVHRVMDGDRLVGHPERFDADGEICGDLGHGVTDVAAKRDDIAALAHRDGKPDRFAAVDAEFGLRRIGVAAMHRPKSLSRKMRPPAAKLVAMMSCSDWKAPARRTRIVSSTVSMAPAGRTALRDASAVTSVAGCRPRLDSSSGEKSTKIRSSWVPISSTDSTSGTCSSRERTSSTWSRSSRRVKPSAVKA